MAQRTGAERFLARPAKGASARLCLALALAALVAPAGCGGGEEDSSGEASSATSSASAETSQAGSAAAKGGAEDGTGAGEGKGPAGSEGATAAQGEGQKRGPRVAEPTGKREQTPSPEEVANATLADMTLISPAITPAQGGPGAIPVAYTCDGTGSWPELRWSGVPTGTAELILYAMSVQPVEGQLFVDWAVAGLDPGLTGIEAGKLPKGAITGTNGYGERGYEICPPEGSGEIYMFALYALPRALAPAKGFDARELRRRILDVSGNVGLLPAVYARG